MHVGGLQARRLSSPGPGAAEAPGEAESPREERGGGASVQPCAGAAAGPRPAGPWDGDRPPVCARRFHCSLTGHQRWVRERSHESYAKNYAVVFPHDEPLAGRSMRTGPLHQVPLPAGAADSSRPGTTGGG